MTVVFAAAVYAGLASLRSRVRCRRIEADTTVPPAAPATTSRSAPRRAIRCVPRHCSRSSNVCRVQQRARGRRATPIRGRRPTSHVVAVLFRRAVRTGGPHGGPAEWSARAVRTIGSAASFRGGPASIRRVRGACTRRTSPAVHDRAARACPRPQRLGSLACERVTSAGARELST